MLVGAVSISMCKKYLKKLKVLVCCHRSIAFRYFEGRLTQRRFINMHFGLVRYRFILRCAENGYTRLQPVHFAGNSGVVGASGSMGRKVESKKKSSMLNNEQKYVTAKRPVNLRAALKESQRQQPISAAVRGRLAVAKMRSAFGLSLAQQLNANAKVSRTKLSAMAISGGIIVAVAAVAVLLAWIQKFLPFALAGLAGVLLGLGIIARQHYSSKSSEITGTQAWLLDAQAVQIFDRMLDEVAHQVPQAVAVQLGEIKDLVARVARRAGAMGTDEHFTTEDRMYLAECVRRYVPDTLQSYLLIPSQQRMVLVIEGQETAVDLLVKQMNLIRTELEKRDLKMTKSSAEKLLRQQQFLESKRS